MLWEESLHDGAHWSGILRRGTTLRLTDMEGGANVSALFYNHEDRLERYSMADTLKAQHTVFLAGGDVCYSDMGRVLCSITSDSCGWHDTICGVSNATLVAQKYGAARFQEERTAFHRNGRDSLLTELGKHGLGARDLVANVNFFSQVHPDEEGRLLFQPGHSMAGSHVELRFEMHTLVVLATCQHPLDPESTYQPRAVQLRAFRTGPAGMNDPGRVRCPENERGFSNTERLYLE
jgi:urea carboxylase-associated protein 2